MLGDKQYLILRQCISQETISILSNYYDIKYRVQKDYDEGDDNTVFPIAKYRYAEPMAEAMLLSCQEGMSNVCGVELLPTYSFVRYYTKGNYLPRHIDRPSCEYSVTLPIHGTGWSIFFEEEEVDLQLGDIVVYKGGELVHHRNALESDLQIQMHLHYVDANGEFSEFKYDKRTEIGAMRNA